LGDGFRVVGAEALERYPSTGGERKFTIPFDADRRSVAWVCYAAIEGQTWQAQKLRFQSKTQRHSRIFSMHHLSFSRGTTRRTGNNPATIQIIRGASSGKCSTIFGIVESRNRPHNNLLNDFDAQVMTTAQFIKITDVY
jgi:hypothetical protein